jgi:hypothetical protein
MFDRIPANRFLIAFAVLASLPQPFPFVFCQEIPASNDFWKARQDIDRICQDRLESIASVATELKINDAELTTTLLALKRDPRRQYIFLPDEKTLEAPGSDDPFEQIKYKQAIQQLRREHASRLFDLAKTIAETDPAQSFQLLNEVAWIDPDHAEARRILGWTKGSNTWSRPFRSIKERPTRNPHELFNWQPGNYSVVRSGHFEVATTADVETVMPIIEKLEVWREIWRQVAFDFWASDSIMPLCFGGSGKFRDSINKRHSVVIFRDRNQYVEHLQKLIPGIEQSSGYYDVKSQTSFFYIADDNQATWRHELVHQLFQESVRENNSETLAQHIWAIEGIAMYFESMQQVKPSALAKPYITLGGFESYRLQFARIRKLREGFYVPMAELTSMDQSQLMQRGDVAHVYSQSAGLAHMIMNDNHGNHRRKFLKWLLSIYEDSNVDDLQKALGKSHGEIDTQYEAYLKVSKAELPFADFSTLQPSILCLRESDLDSDSLERLKDATALSILDLGKTNIDDKGLDVLGNFHHMTQLFLDETKLTDRAIGSVTTCAQLRELDIAGTQITNASLDSIAKLQHLQILWLSDTKIDDDGIKKLAALKDLISIDVSRTAVTDAGLKWLKSQLPNLK